MEAIQIDSSQMPEVRRQDEGYLLVELPSAIRGLSKCRVLQGSGGFFINSEGVRVLSRFWQRNW